MNVMTPDVLTLPALQPLQQHYGRQLDMLPKDDKLRLILLLVQAVTNAQDGASDALPHMAETMGIVFQDAALLHETLWHLDEEIDEPLALQLVGLLVEQLQHVPERTPVPPLHSVPLFGGLLPPR
jgi:hypothetical protein